MIRIFKSGRHAQRSPLSYQALAPLFAEAIELVDRPEQADLYLFAHSLDIEAAPEELVLDWRRRRRPVVLLSEEPFWDTIWTGRPLERQTYVETAWGALPVVQLNHSTSRIFQFWRIPYYLLTNHRFVNAYRWRFCRNAARSTADWQAYFAARRVEIVFMFERRPEPFHDVRWEADNLIGLCAWRTRLAEACGGSDHVELLGRSWQPGVPRRQELSDWHLDKLTRLDGHARSLAAFENTHHPDYITEKFFDAMACGARPLYYAAPGHRIHGFGVPGDAWLNLYGCEAAKAARSLSMPFADARYCEAWREGQHALAALFSDSSVLVQERARLRQELLLELHGILQSAM